MDTKRANKSIVLAMAFASGMLGVGSLQANSVSYDLTLTNDVTGNILNGTPYVRVTIDDEGNAGLINFTVTILDSLLTDNKDNNFGLQSFGFNVLTPGNADGLVTADIINLPNSDWSANVSFNPPNSGGTGQSIFGKFDVVVADGGQSRVDPTLAFSIDLGLNQGGTDSIFDYIAGSSNSIDNLFVAHVLGFTDLNPLGPVSGCVDLNPPDEDWSPECNILTSVWVGGGTVVPVPAAVWLFGSGLLGLVGMARRKKA